MTNKLVLSIIVFLFFIVNSMAEIPEITINPGSEEYTRLSAGLSGSNISIIDAKTIRKNPNKNLPQILETYSGINSRTTLSGVNGAYTNIDIRGFGEASVSNVLILVNGKRLNEIDMSGVNFSHIPIDSIERIEIIRGGSAATLYGSGAVGGAINVVTNNEITKNITNVGLGSYNKRKLNFNLGIPISSERSISLFGSKFLNDNYRDAADYDGENLLLNLRQKIDNLDFNLDFTSSRQNKDLPGPRVKNGAVFNYHFCNRYEDSKTAKHIGGSFLTNGNKCNVNQRDDYANTEMEMINGSLKVSQDELNKLFVNFGHKTKKDIAFLADNTSTIHSPTNSDRYLETIIDGQIFNIRYENKKITEDQSNILNFGFDHAHSYYESKRYRTEGDPLGHNYDADLEVNSYYFQNTTFLNEASLSISFGYRYEKSIFGGRDERDPTVTGFVPSFWFDPSPEHDTLDKTDNNQAFNIGFEKRLNKEYSLYGGYAESFRIPNIDERIAATSSSSFELKTQKSDGYDIGIRYQNISFNVNASYYEIDTVDEIQLAYAPANDPINTNLDPINREGVNVDLRFDVDKENSFRGSFNYVQAKFTAGELTPGSGGENACDWQNNTYCSNSSIWKDLMGGGTSYSLVGKSVPLVAPISYSIGYERKIRNNMVFDILLKYTDKKYVSNDQENVEPKMPDYYLVDTYLRSENNNYTFTFGVNNLLDKSAYDFAVSSPMHDDAHHGLVNVYPLPERNFFIDLGYTF